MKLYSALLILTLCACSRTTHSFLSNDHNNFPVSCEPGQEELAFALHADEPLKKLISEKFSDPSFGVAFPKSDLPTKAQNDYSGTLLNTSQGANDEVILNVCVDKESNEVKKLRSAEVSLYGLNFMITDFLKVEGLNEAIYGEFDNFHIMARPTERSDYLFLMEGNSNYKAAAATLAKQGEQGLVYFDETDAPLTYGLKSATLGYFELREKAKADGCVGNNYRSENYIRLEGLDVKLDLCIGQGEPLTMGFHIMGIEVVDYKADPPLKFKIEDGTHTINKAGDAVLIAKDDESIRVESSYSHHNQSDYLNIVHPDLDITYGNGLFSVKRKQDVEAEDIDFGPSHFVMGIYDRPNFELDMVFKFLVGAEDVASNQVDLYVTGAKNLCFDDRANIFQSHDAIVELPLLTEAVLASPAMAEIVRSRSNDPTAQIVRVIKDVPIKPHFQQFSVVYKDSAAGEKKLRIVGCNAGPF